MARMYRLLGFISLLIALMALWGDLMTMFYIFLAQMVLFVALGYMNLREKTYLYLFWGYMAFSFAGYLFYTFFLHTPPQI
ncbi:DUF2626 family protein [Rubeoparvulum massiliense]|uniref:DUF2626 family protein n=1 Tax=Rubeoparvulum massiliense TaxID=1631346 RepID=UPI00065DE403|nr:DUF2626 family protein [Rubeoparvulum massiliense]